MARIAIVGAGAMGSVYAGLMASALARYMRLPCGKSTRKP